MLILGLLKNYHAFVHGHHGLLWFCSYIFSYNINILLSSFAPVPEMEVKEDETTGLTGLQTFVVTFIHITDNF